jgi:hypothetical protein
LIFSSYPLQVLPKHITFGTDVDLEMLFNMMDVDGTSRFSFS